ncbi:MAG: hypothetical protein ACFUZC_02075 [Chthoniobacteraceae bacterium]
MKRIIFYLAALLVIGILLGFAVPRVYTGPVKPGPIIQAANNARQIQIALLQSGKGLPGDLKASGEIGNLPDFVNLLVRSGALKPGDLKLFSSRGIKAYQGNLDATGYLAPPFKDENSSFKVYLVRESDPPDTFLMATKNFTYGKPLDPKAVPLLGGKGFVVIRKSGDVCIYKRQQVFNFQLIGRLPGGGTVESPENCLNP